MPLPATTVFSIPLLAHPYTPSKSKTPNYCLTLSHSLLQKVDLTSPDYHRFLIKTDVKINTVA